MQLGCQQGRIRKEEGEGKGGKQASKQTDGSCSQFTRVISRRIWFGKGIHWSERRNGHIRVAREISELRLEALATDEGARAQIREAGELLEEFERLLGKLACRQYDDGAHAHLVRSFISNCSVFRMIDLCRVGFQLFDQWDQESSCFP